MLSIFLLNFRSMGILRVFLLLSISAISFAASESQDFWAPRDTEVLYATDIMSSYHSVPQLERDQSRCSTNSRRPILCDLVKKIKVPPQFKEPTLSNFLDFDTQLLIIGEKHASRAPKKVLSHWLFELKKAYGYTHLALEPFNHTSQKDLNRYLVGELSDQDLNDTLKSQWGFRSEPYIEAIKKAKELGFKLIALDKRDDNELSSNFSESIIQRDQFWASILDQHFKDHPKAKVVLLSGKVHALESFSTNEIEIKTVIEQVRENSNIKGQSLLVFGKRSKSLYNTLKNHFYPNQSLLYTGEEIRPYTSGILLSED